MGFERQCLGDGCVEFACFGMKRGADYAWSCLAHRELLEIGSGLPPAPPEPKAREGEGMLALPLPGSLAPKSNQGRLI